MAAVMILFSLFATILLFGMIGDKEANNRRNYTYAFCSVVIVSAIIIFKYV